MKLMIRNHRISDVIVLIIVINDGDTTFANYGIRPTKRFFSLLKILLILDVRPLRLGPTIVVYAQNALALPVINRRYHFSVPSRQTSKSHTQWRCSCKTTWCWSTCSARDIRVSRTHTRWTFTSHPCRASITSPTARQTWYRHSIRSVRGPHRRGPATARTSGPSPAVSGAQRPAATTRSFSPGE